MAITFYREAIPKVYKDYYGTLTMMSILTIGLFFIYCWGLGYTATYYLSKRENVWEQLFLQIGIGLGIFPILAILLNFLHIPLDWKVFLGLSLIFPLYVLGRKLLKKELKLPPVQFKLTKSSLFLLVVLVIFAVSLFMYTKGAFSYPYLEDEDPWGHAVGAKYVAMEKNAYDPELRSSKEIDPVLSYIDPYPPAYDILMGILHQTSADLQWTIKFFNALIISLGILFFYLFAQEFFGSKGKALLATFFLAAIPAYLSHFIWAHSLVITLLFPALYALMKIREDTRWWYVAAIIVASIWVTQNIEQPIKLTVMLLIFVVVASITKSKWLWQEWAARGSGMAISLLWWGVMIRKYTLAGFLRYFAGDVAGEADIAITSSISETGLLTKLAGFWQKLTSPGGSGSRAYTASDFFHASSENAINGPIGLGAVMTVLSLAGLLYLLWKYKSSIIQEKNSYKAVILFWLIYAFWAVNGRTFPFSIARGPFRAWMLLAIPVALISADFLFEIKERMKNKITSFAVIGIILAAVFFTSFVPKYEFNTMPWPTSGSFTNQQEPWEYGAWFKTIPPDTKVFLYSPRDKLTIGYNAFSCIWCEEVLNFRKNILPEDAQALHSFLRQNEYEYLLINGNMDAKYFKGLFGENETAALLPQRYEEIQRSGLFTPVHYKEGMFLVMKVE